MHSFNQEEIRKHSKKLLSTSQICGIKRDGDVEIPVYPTHGSSGKQLAQENAEAALHSEFEYVRPERVWSGLHGLFGKSCEVWFFLIQEFHTVRWPMT